MVLFAIFFLGLLDLSLQEKANAPEKSNVSKKFYKYALSFSKHTFLKIIYLILDPFERISKIFNVVKFPVSFSIPNFTDLLL